MAEYKDLFVVSSALITDYGFLPAEERVVQTLQTLASIRQHAPHADIVVLELSRTRISEAYENRFAHYAPRHILHFHEHPVIQQHYQQNSVEKDPNGNLIKNMNEIAAMQAFLQWALGQQYFHGYRRVFKISGRYQLTEAFQPHAYDDVAFQARCAFLCQQPSFFDPANSGAYNYAYMTRLWSFDPVLAPRLEVWFESMYDMLLKRYLMGGYVDIEHLLTVAIPRRYCLHLQQVGVRGVLGLNATQIDE